MPQEVQAALPPPCISNSPPHMSHRSIDAYNQYKNKSSAEIWQGENDVEIILSSCEALGVNLVYVWRGAEALIDEAFEISDEIGDTITGNTSGL